MYKTCQTSTIVRMAVLQDSRTHTYEITEEQTRTEYNQVPNFVYR